MSKTKPTVVYYFVTMLDWAVFLQTKQKQAAIVGCSEMLKPPPIQLFISVLWPISDEYRGGGEIQQGNAYAALSPVMRLIGITVLP